jgi:predicted DNA-binding transcriptional regulator AlpA
MMLLEFNMSGGERFQNGVPQNWIKYLSEKDFSAISGFSVYTIQQWRHYDKGPIYRKIGTSVRYLLTDIQKWMDETIVTPRNATDMKGDE